VDALEEEHIKRDVHTTKMMNGAKETPIPAKTRGMAKEKIVAKVESV
jgi:hypothetical protein